MKTITIDIKNAWVCPRCRLIMDRWECPNCEKSGFRIDRILGYHIKQYELGKSFEPFDKERGS